MTIHTLIPVIDIFAGPGGLGEGFSAFQTDRKQSPFKVRLSIEKDPDARQTLRLRSFFRKFRRDEVPDLYYKILRQEVGLLELPDRLQKAPRVLRDMWNAADEEVLQEELGASEAGHARIAERIKQALADNGNRHWVLIGGPPCQAYSIAGRVRNLGNSEYRIEDDHRSSLYLEYLRIISEHWPAVFVMENVKGLLSATVQNQRVFEKILNDLQSPREAFGDSRNIRTRERYRIIPVIQPGRSLLQGNFRPHDFVVECEKYGIPQERHRVILVGIREDLGDISFSGLKPSPANTVEEVIGDLPKLRSGLSRTRVDNRYQSLTDNSENWLRILRQHDSKDCHWLTSLKNGKDARVHAEILKTVRELEPPPQDRGQEFIPGSLGSLLPESIRSWYMDRRIKGVCNHQTRIHMDSDLSRYLFAACYAKVHQESPKLPQFPDALQPNHENAATGHFDDRFRVQVASRPSTTITSHLSKDGHYFIHYDPAQCRSLTVREVARLQTFPDNYFFCGPRTSQYVQVGNAVPPLLARQIARCVWDLLKKAGKVE